MTVICLEEEICHADSIQECFTESSREVILGQRFSVHVFFLLLIDLSPQPGFLPHLQTIYIICDPKVTLGANVSVGGCLSHVSLCWPCDGRLICLEYALPGTGSAWHHYDHSFVFTFTCKTSDNSQIAKALIRVCILHFIRMQMLSQK